MITKLKAMAFAVAGLALCAAPLHAEGCCHKTLIKVVKIVKYYHYSHCCHYHPFPIDFIVYSPVPFVPYYYYSPYSVEKGVLVHVAKIILPKD